MPLLMSIDGIRNSSEVPGYEGWLLLTGFNWSGTREAAFDHQPSGRRMARALAPQLRAVRVTRVSDFVTAQVWELLLTSTKKTVEFVWLRTGDNGLIPYLKLRLDKALITGMAEMAPHNAPEESISFTYEKITFTVVNIGDRLSGAQDVASYDLPLARRE
jgi:type VI protein secretion system component Hcp